MFSQRNIVPLNDCLACGNDRLLPTLDLGKQPLANSFKETKDEIQEEFPLAINRCSDCYHVQLTHAVNPELMFKNYLYVSGTSFTMKEHFKWFAFYALETFSLLNHGKKAATVFDIGCNDGSQLDYFLKFTETYGVDPAENLYPISSKNHTVWNDFFGIDFVQKCDGKRFDILVAQNVFAHNTSPKRFLDAARNIMHDDSILLIQTSQADMILNNEFDTIYGEHINFFNINSMNELCKRSGFYLVDVVKCPLHGNSFIFVLSKDSRKERPAHIKNLIDMERKSGLYSEQTYIDYKISCEDIRHKLLAYYKHWSSDSYKFIGYGAAAKGMTLLNYTGLKLDFIIDDNPLKQGKFAPGSNIPIVGIEKLDELDSEKKIAFVPLAWNFFDEIKARILLRRNKKLDIFIRYFPDVRID